MSKEKRIYGENYLNNHPEFEQILLGKDMFDIDLVIVDKKHWKKTCKLINELKDKVEILQMMIPKRKIISDDLGVRFAEEPKPHNDICGDCVRLKNINWKFNPLTSAIEQYKLAQKCSQCKYDKR